MKKGGNLAARIARHAFEYACATNDIGHRTTKARYPRTNDQVSG
jgi:hypothetical protein